MEYTDQFIQPESLAVMVENVNQRITLSDSLRLTAFNKTHQILNLVLKKSIVSVANDFL